MLLDASKSYAVCYDDGIDVSSYGTVYGSGTIGTASSKTWRDSYIRLKVIASPLLPLVQP